MAFTSIYSRLHTKVVGGAVPVGSSEGEADGGIVGTDVGTDVGSKVG